MPLKLLHTADVHLDAPFRWLGSRGREQRDQVSDTFRRVVDLAIAERVDAFLIAGDLFDSNLPSQSTVDLVIQQLRRLTMPVFLLPGTHDCLDATSIYHKMSLPLAGRRVHFFDHEHLSFDIPDLRLSVHGMANLTKTSPLSPLRELRPNATARYNVALAHGSLAMPGVGDDFPFGPNDIDQSRMDYLALGHWHSYRNCSGRLVTACYPGPPELLGEEQEGAVLIVELSDMSPKIVAHSLSRRHWQPLDIAVDELTGLEALRMLVKSLRNRDTALSVRLTGIRSLDLILEPGELAREMADDFFSVRVVDRTLGLASSEHFDSFPPELVIGQFVRRMREQIASAADDGERRVREKALQIGVALLQGRKVL